MRKFAWKLVGGGGVGFLVACTAARVHELWGWPQWAATLFACVLTVMTVVAYVAKG